MLNGIERRQEIVRLTETNRRVDVGALAAQFEVSKVTIRQDLKALSQRGLVVRSHGGAVASTPLALELSLEEKYKNNLAIKRRLGRAVAGLLGDDVRSIGLDSGTTAEEVALSLVGREGLAVTTNGLNVATALAKADGIEVRITGGTLRKQAMSFYGRQAEESLRHMHFDRFILGADGIDVDVGVTTHFEPEAHLNRMMCEAARQVILVADASKFGRFGAHVIRRLGDIDVLVTDAGIPADLPDRLARIGVELHVVGERPGGGRGGSPVSPDDRQ